MQKLSKEVIAWGEGLINHYILDVLERRPGGKRKPGDQYSRFNDDGVTTKKNIVPEVGLGHPTRDINHKRTPGDVPEFSSYNEADREIYGADVPPDDETKPGGGRMISPRGEPIVPTQQQTSLMSDDPVTKRQVINNLYGEDRDHNPAGTKKLLNSLYNEKIPLRFKHKVFDVDSRR